MSLPSDVQDIPPLDSMSSLGTGSPTLLSPETSDVRSSSPAVKFAPLPQIDPTRKRCLAPVGASARSRRRHIIQQEAGPLLWTTRDPGLPEDILEDPLITLAKFVKKTSRTLWRRVKKSGKTAIAAENVTCPGEPVLDIRSREGDKQRRRATWSPLEERRTPDEPRRRKSDLSGH